MPFTFPLSKDPIDAGFNLFSGENIYLEPGVTVLVGCNGYGKTTFLRMLKQMLENESIPFVSFDNLSEGGSHARSKAGWHGDYEFLATSLTSSEGENINLNLGNTMRDIARAQLANKNAEKFFIFMDAVDSGLSIDNIADLLDMFPFIMEHHPNSAAEVYIIVSANTYEMARSCEQCLDVHTGKYRSFKDYDDYRVFIHETRRIKDLR